MPISYDFEEGQTVRQKVALPDMTVKSYEKIGRELFVFVTWTDAAGNQHERAFREDELEAV